MPKTVAEAACSGLVTAVKVAALHRNRNMRRAAQHAAASSNRGSFLVRTAYNEVLNNPILVQNILGFVGPGQHLYIATISRHFSRCYEQVESYKVDAFDSEGRPKRIAVDAHTTRMSEVCKSWARIAEAADIGVPVLANRSFLQKVAARLLGHAAAAAKPGRHFDLGLPKEGYVACAAAVAGRAATVQWLMEEKHCTLQSTSSALAAVGGHLNVLIYLHKINFPFHPNTSMRAARNDTCEAAAHGGHLSVLQWLYEQECPRDAAKLKHTAAATGQIHIMQWLLLRDGRNLLASVISKAASKGRLPMCKLLLKEGCQFNPYACHLAAQGGYLGVLQYLHEQGCPWVDYAVAVSSASTGRIDLMTYVLQHTAVPGDLYTLSNMMRVAGAHGHLAAAKWLKGNQWSGEVLAWAIAEGCTSPVYSPMQALSDLVDLIAVLRDYEVALWWLWMASTNENTSLWQSERGIAFQSENMTSIELLTSRSWGNIRIG
eukprot:14279-Heterococcus_DN1.PRE.6